MLFKVINSSGEYAFLMESNSIQYQIERNCDLIQVGNGNGDGDGIDNGKLYLILIYAQYYTNHYSPMCDSLYRSNPFRLESFLTRRVTGSPSPQALSTGGFKFFAKKVCQHSYFLRVPISSAILQLQVCRND